MSDTDEWLTVAEAARRLGIAPRQVRRYADKLGTGDRDTGGTSSGQGQGPSPLRVRFSAVAALRADGGTKGQSRDTDRDKDRDTQGQSPGTPEDTAPEATMPAMAFQRVIAEQAARIDSLERDKERLYNALQLAQENLKREQSLRLIGVERAELPAEASAQGQAPQAEPPGSPETEGGQAKDTETGATGPEKGPEGPKAGWWARLWGKGDK